MTSRKRAKEAAFVFDFLKDGACETTITWDDGITFVESFLEEFPDKSGCRDDAALRRASKRLSVLCRTLYEDGWLRRWSVSNHSLYHPRNEPRWQYVYALWDGDLKKMKEGVMNGESMAERWSGLKIEYPYVVR